VLGGEAPSHPGRRRVITLVRHPTCSQGLIPLVSTRAAEMKSYLDPTEDDDFTDVELTLDVTCTSDATMDVTSDMLMPDPRYPEIVPVHQVCALCTSAASWGAVRRMGKGEERPEDGRLGGQGG
jgi:hypothetical protein